MINLHLIPTSCVQVIVYFFQSYVRESCVHCSYQNENTAKEPILLCRYFVKWLTKELCKEVSSYGQYQLLHKREETSQNTFAFGSDLSWQFLFWLLIPSFNLRILFKAITDQTSLMLALFFKEKVKYFWQTQFYLLVYLCISSPLMFFTASFIFFPFPTAC